MPKERLPRSGRTQVIEQFARSFDRGEGRRSPWQEASNPLILMLAHELKKFTDFVVFNVGHVAIKLGNLAFALLENLINILFACNFELPCLKF